MTSSNQGLTPTGRVLASVGAAALMALAPMALVAQDVDATQEAEVTTSAEDMVTIHSDAGATVTSDTDDSESISDGDAAPDGAGDEGEPAVAPPPPPPPSPPPPPPPPPPPEPPLEVYIAVSGQTTGPFDRAALMAQVEAGTLTPSTYVWEQGMADWERAADVPEVAALVGKAVDQAEPEGYAVDDPVAYLSGRWTFSAEDVEVEGGLRGAAEGEMFFTPDGRMLLRQTFRVTSPREMTITISARGNFTAEALSPTRFVVHPQLEAVYALDGVEQANELLTDPTTIDVIDADSMRDDEGMLISRGE